MKLTQTLLLGLTATVLALPVFAADQNSNNAGAPVASTDKAAPVNPVTDNATNKTDNQIKDLKQLNQLGSVNPQQNAKN